MRNVVIVVFFLNILIYKKLEFFFFNNFSHSIVGQYWANNNFSVLLRAKVYKKVL